jgi:hypothetical protein
MSFIADNSASTAVRRVNREGCKLTPDPVEHPHRQSFRMERAVSSPGDWMERGCRFQPSG